MRFSQQKFSESGELGDKKRNKKKERNIWETSADVSFKDLRFLSMVKQPLNSFLKNIKTPKNKFFSMPLSTYLDFFFDTITFPITFLRMSLFCLFIFTPQNPRQYKPNKMNRKMFQLYRKLYNF